MDKYKTANANKEVRFTYQAKQVYNAPTNTTTVRGIPNQTAAMVCSLVCSLIEIFWSLVLLRIAKCVRWLHLQTVVVLLLLANQHPSVDQLPPCPALKN